MTCRPHRRRKALASQKVGRVRCALTQLDEAALYDRQIRLWGLEAQNRLRSAHIVVVTLSGVATEVIKNVVLAGIGKLTIVDAGIVLEEDLSASFFFRADDVGQPRISDAPLQRIQQLNPHVGIQGVAHEGVLSHKALQELRPNVVIVTSGTKEELVQWNDACRSADAMFFASAAQGMGGFVFCDLGALTYATERPSPDDPSEKVLKRFEQTFVPLSESLKAPWSFRPSPGLIATLAQWAIMQDTTPPSTLNDYEQALETHASDIMSSKNAKAASVFRRRDAKTFYAHFAKATYDAVTRRSTASFAPTCAILGGFVAQAVLNALGQREEPVVNWCILDAAMGSADIHLLGPASMAQPTAL